jgi:hypothetical protein
MSVWVARKVSAHTYGRGGKDKILPRLVGRFDWNRTLFGSPLCNSLIGIATGYGLDDRGFAFALLHVVQTGPGVHPNSYPVGRGESFPEDKAARA